MSESARSAMPGLTPRRLQILTAIRDYQHKHGYSPTMQELADKVGVSKVTIFEHVESLIENGFLRRSRNKARSLEISSDAAFPDEQPGRLPLIGRIAAGSPIEAVEDTQAIDLDELFTSHRETFCLQVRGDSMIEEQIRDGDYVICERRETARDGETVVALLDDGEATLKKFYHEGDRVRLQPANPSFSPIYLDRVKIQGVVVGVLRRY